EVAGAPRDRPRGQRPAAAAAHALDAHADANGDVEREAQDGWAATGAGAPVAAALEQHRELQRGEPGAGRGGAPAQLRRLEPQAARELGSSGPRMLAPDGTGGQPDGPLARRP